LWARAATVLAGPVFNVFLTLAVFALMVTVWGIIREEDKPVIGSVQALPALEATLRPGDQIVSIAGIVTPDVVGFYEAIKQLPPSQTVTWTLLRDGIETEVNGPYPLAPIVGSVMSKSAAMDAGLAGGDVILAIGGTPVESFEQISPVVEAANGTPLVLTVWRDGKTFDLTLSPRRRDLPTAEGGFETRWLIGLTSSMAVELQRVRPSVLEVAQLSWENTVAVMKSSVNGIVAIVRGQISSCNISGAITMAVVVGDAAKSGWESFLGTLAVLSLGIGLMNLFPIPVLDGGHLVFHAWEALTGRPPSARILSTLTLIGLALVLGLMVYALGNDLTCR
jgi:regulator of sigma E protease